MSTWNEKRTTANKWDFTINQWYFLLSFFILQPVVTAYFQLTEIPFGWLMLLAVIGAGIGLGFEFFMKGRPTQQKLIVIAVLVILNCVARAF